MNKQKLDQLIERVGKQAGFECPECKDSVERIKQLPKDARQINRYYCCGHCNSTMKDPNINTSKLLMNIVCELSDAVRAWDKVADLGIWDKQMTKFRENFSHIPDNLQYDCYTSIRLNSREHHLAGAFIRLIELAYYKDVTCKVDEYVFDGKHENLHKNITEIIEKVLDGEIKLTYTLLVFFCNHHKIDIEKHIDARLSWECVE